MHIFGQKYSSISLGLSQKNEIEKNGHFNFRFSVFLQQNHVPIDLSSIRISVRIIIIFGM